jgi:hypothetical protein
VLIELIELKEQIKAYWTDSEIELKSAGSISKGPNKRMFRYTFQLEIAKSEYFAIANR